METDSINRFSSRVENYSRYRPGYPQAVIGLLVAQCGLTPKSIIADVGSGTGILSGLFLPLGNQVYCVEPNEGMRAAAERLLRAYAGFQSIDGTAEATTLAPGSVDLVTAGQAFHWFDQEKARQEFGRILRPKGWVVLIWNERRLESTAFLRAYEDLLLEFGTDYEQVRHEHAEKDLARFFAPAEARLATFENRQEFGFEGLRGRLLSSSYIPSPDDDRFAPMLEKAREIFLTHQHHDRVTVEYNTRVYYGRLPLMVSN